MNGFRKLQERLKEEGWYVGWNHYCCQSCAWMDVPDYFDPQYDKDGYLIREDKDGNKIEYKEVDLAKVLFNHSQDCEYDVHEEFMRSGVLEEGEDDFDDDFGEEGEEEDDDEEAEKFTTSADKRFWANSKDNLVRVEFSKNRFATVKSLRDGTFLMGLFKTSLNSDVVLKMSSRSSRVMPRIPKRCLIDNSLILV